MTDDAADVVRRRQVTAEGDAENFERGVTGDARQQRRQLDAVTSAAVMEDDFLRLGSIQHQIVHSRPRRYDGVCGRCWPGRRGKCGDFFTEAVHVWRCVQDAQFHALQDCN